MFVMSSGVSDVLRDSRALCSGVLHAQWSCAVCWFLLTVVGFLVYFSLFYFE